MGLQTRLKLFSTAWLLVKLLVGKNHIYWYCNFEPIIFKLQAKENKCVIDIGDWDSLCKRGEIIKSKRKNAAMMNLSWKCQYDLMIFKALKGLEILTAINTPKSYKYPVKIKRLLDTFQD